MKQTSQNDDSILPECGAASNPIEPCRGYICNLRAGHAGPHERRVVYASWGYESADTPTNDSYPTTEEQT